MATGKRYFWIKLKESFMTSDVVDYLMGQRNGANYVVLYEMLCLKTINTGGKLSSQIGEIIIPYDVEKIVRDCKWFSADTVRVAMSLYKSIGLIYEDKDGVLVLADHTDLVGSETDYAQKNRRLRSARNTALPAETGHIVSTDVSENVSTDIEIDKETDIRGKDIDEEEDINITPQAEKCSHTPPCPFAKIKELFNRICTSYPEIKGIEGNRKKAVAARWRLYGSLEPFEQVFTKAQASSFLKGENKRNWSATFDWLMSASNFVKVLEGRYDEYARPQQQEQPQGTLNVLNSLYRKCDGDD